jgi:formylglycine-generating enzyme required for sulfatase activity
VIFGRDAERAAPILGDRNFSHPRQPVAAVSWFDALAYCAWLPSMTGSQYRLAVQPDITCDQSVIIGRALRR